MMSVYLGSYDPGATHTVALARSLAKVRQRLDTRSRLLVDEVPAVLDPYKGAVALGSLMSQMDDPWQGLRDLHLLSPHAPGIMDFAHIAFVDRLAPRLDQPAEIDRLLRWLKPDGHEPRASGAGEAIEALLMPWRDRDPSPHMQHDLITRVVGYYGDPRVRGHAGAWSSVSDELLTILLRWLTGANIRFFLEVVSAVEDSHMWAPREKFWLTLYNQKRIDAAWVAFSDAGAALARRKVGNRTIPLAAKLQAAIVQARAFSSSRSEERSSSRDRATTRSISSTREIRELPSSINILTTATPFAGYPAPRPRCILAIGRDGCSRGSRPDELAMFIFRSPDQPQGTTGQRRAFASFDVEPNKGPHQTLPGRLWNCSVRSET